MERVVSLSSSGDGLPMLLRKRAARPCSLTTLAEMGTQCTKMIETIITDTTEIITTTGTGEEMTDAMIDAGMTDATIIDMAGDGTEAAAGTERALREGMMAAIETIAETGTETRDEKI